MKLSAEDQINCIKHRVYCLNEPTIQIKALDMLAELWNTGDRRHNRSH